MGTMTQEEINNGNRLIEDLMGKTIKVNEPDVKDIPLVFLAIEDMKFHQSWKWLMPVVVRVEEEFGYSVLIKEKTCEIRTDGDKRFESSTDSKMESVWRAVIDCLAWKKEG